MTSSNSPQTVVIVGGGCAGILTRNTLAAKIGLTSSIKIVLITPRPYHNHLPGTLRMLVSNEGHLEERNFMYFPDDFNAGNKEVIIAKVVSIVDEGNNRHVVLDNGETVAYTVLLFTPGSVWEGPVAFPQEKDGDLDWVKTWRDRFEKANEIVLVGGGSVSIELAGELKDIYPNKNVTIVHSHELLMNPVYPVGWRKSITQKIAKRGVHLVLGDRIEDIEPRNGAVRTTAGKRITADLVIPMRGPRPNTKFISESLGSETLTASGFVKVQPSLQLVGRTNIFAAGDIIDWKEEKQAVKAISHASIAANNIAAVLRGDVSAIKEYKGSSEMIIVTNGKNGGATYMGLLWGLTLGDWFSSMVKSKSLIIENMRGAMKLQAAASK